MGGGRRYFLAILLLIFFPESSIAGGPSKNNHLYTSEVGQNTKIYEYYEYKTAPGGEMYIYFVYLHILSSIYVSYYLSILYVPQNFRLPL